MACPVVFQAVFREVFLVVCPEACPVPVVYPEPVSLVRVACPEAYPVPAFCRVLVLVACPVPVVYLLEAYRRL